jgi:hypothetical protein
VVCVEFRRGAPGVTLIFSFTETPVTGTGVKLDAAYRKVPRMGFAVVFLTDPWAPGLSRPSERRYQRRRKARTGAIIVRCPSNPSQS